MEDLQIAVEHGVRLLDPKFRRRIQDINKEREENEAKDRDAEERKPEGRRTECFNQEHADRIQCRGRYESRGRRLRRRLCVGGAQRRRQ